MKNRILLIALAALMLASCGNAESKTDASSVSATTTTAAVQPSGDAGTADGDVAADAEIPADDAFAAADPETSSDDEVSSAADADVQDTTTTTAAASSNADTSASTTTTAPQKAASSTTTTTTTTASASKKPASSTTTTTTTTTASKKPASSTTTTSKKTSTTTTTKKTTTTTTTKKTTTTTTTKKTTTTTTTKAAVLSAQDKRVAEFVQRVTNGKSDKLRACFDAIVNEFCYSMQPLPTVTKGWEVQSADNMLTRGYGNCFEFAALFARCGQYLGYDVRTVDNDITTYNGNTAHHCWTELHENGKVYVIDTETYYEVLQGWLKIHRCDFFKIEYSQVPYPMDYFPKK